MVVIGGAAIRSAIKENLRAADVEGMGTVEFRNKLRAQFSYAVELCRQGVFLVCEASGTIDPRSQPPDAALPAPTSW